MQGQNILTPKTVDMMFAAKCWVLNARLNVKLIVIIIYGKRYGLDFIYSPK